MAEKKKKRKVARDTESGEFITQEKAAADKEHSVVEELTDEPEGDHSGEQKVQVGRDASTGRFESVEDARKRHGAVVETLIRRSRKKK